VLESLYIFPALSVALTTDITFYFFRYKPCLIFFLTFTAIENVQRTAGGGLEEYQVVKVLSSYRGVL